MNSMNDVYNDIMADLKPIKADAPFDRQLSVVVEPSALHNALTYLKQKGFTQMSLLTCVDWIEDSEFELVYILMNWEDGLHVQLRTRIDRDEASFVTITNIFPGAQYYERDVHEFFGVEFKGNEDSYKPLFLELWEELPPMRKDFDTQAYSDEKYSSMEWDVDFDVQKGGTDNERS